ncbi:MAG: hypothetical protein WKG03_00470 [Telluria sp.]
MRKTEYTVVGVDYNRMIVTFSVMATDPLGAFAEAACLEECDQATEFVIAFKAERMSELHDDYGYPGEGVVDANTVRAQADVFEWEPR